VFWGAVPCGAKRRLLTLSLWPLSSGGSFWSRGRGLAKTLAVLLLLAGSLVFGEPLQARVSGIVIDASGAVVPGASVALKHADTVVGSLKTDADGRFLFEQVAPGKYEVEVRLDGFKTARVRAMVGKGSSAPLSIPLEVAPVAEEVTVGEGGLSTHPGENRDAATVDRKLLDGLPVFSTRTSSQPFRGFSTRERSARTASPSSSTERRPIECSCHRPPFKR
jgi:hypothetical protein